MTDKLEGKKFQKKSENFKCGNCGASVKGEGYRNHCPKCLWSKHVDIRGEYVIIHKCQRCKAERKNKTAKDDDMDLVISIAKK